MKLNYQYFNTKHNHWFDISQKDAEQASSVGLKIRKKSKGKELTLQTEK